MANEENKLEETIIDNLSSSRYCYLCYSLLDSNKACTNPDCILYGIPQE